MPKPPENPETSFRKERLERSASYPGSKANKAALEFLQQSAQTKYSYNFDWMQRPIIQMPQDIIAIQEIIMQTKPDLIIETGIAHGGSLIFNASMLALLDLADESASKEKKSKKNSPRKVVGIDIDIRPHNKTALEAHPLFNKLDLLQGSSTDKDIVSQVEEIAGGYDRIMVCLDSNHTHDHVLSELNLYSPLVSPGCYCIVFDTLIEFMPDSIYPDRPWGKGDNPSTAVSEFIKTLKDKKLTAKDGKQLLFKIDSDIDNKIWVSMNPGGYLQRYLPEE